MKNEIRTYKVKLRVITPLFVGGGKIINKSQYIDFKNNENKRVVRMINGQKLVGFLSEHRVLNEYEKYIFSSTKSNSIDLYNFLKTLKNKGKIPNIPLKDLCDYTINTFDLDEKKERLNDIHLFVKNIYQQPYIPGSSLKGALRTALINAMVSQSIKNQEKGWRILCDRTLNKKECERRFQDFEKNLMRVGFEKKSVRDPSKIELLRGFSISDSEPMEPENLGLYQKIDYNIKKNTAATLPLFRECLKPGTETTFTISLDSYWLKGFEKKGFRLESFSDIAAALDLNWENLTEMLPIGEQSHRYVPMAKKGEALLPLGGGAGYHSKTIVRSMAPNHEQMVKKVGYLLHKDKGKISLHKNDRVASPRVLKIAGSSGEEKLMGVVSLSEVKNA